MGPKSTHWLPSSAGNKTTMVGPSTGGPNQHAGPLPIQAIKQLWWVPALEAQIDTLAPVLCRPGTTKMGPSTGGPNQHIDLLPLQAWNQPRWAPSLEAPNQHTGPFLCKPEIILLAPFLCRPKSTWVGPTMQAKINYHWLHSAGQNQLLLSPPWPWQYTKFAKRHQCQPYYPPAPLQWWPPQ